ATLVMTLFLLLVVTAENIYIAALNLTALMVLPPYLFCGLYLWKMTMNEKGGSRLKGSVAFNRFVAAAEIAFCLYIMWAGTFRLLMVTSIFYVAGVLFFVLARLQNSNNPIKKGGWIRPVRIMGDIFTRLEFFVFLILTAIAILSVVLLVRGEIRLDV
ncbi:MAG: hypothetical protein K2L89_07705, partial [Muribaculaceae bacterium]|nr:hypothetical protein [Muribaculaceae bacterium]